MDFAHFIPTRGTDPLRRILWGHYSTIGDYFEHELGFTATVQSVREVAPGEEPHHVAGRIAIPFDEMDQEVVFHELTHDLFEHSVFHRNHNLVNAFPDGFDEDAAFNEAWGEGFCDAVRWLMENVWLPTSPWLTSFPNRAMTDWRLQRADRILKYTGRSLVGFSNGWGALVAGYDGSADYLNETIP